MFYKTLAAATLSLALSTGAVFAQAQTSSGAEPSSGAEQNSTTTAPGTPGMTFASDAERMMYEENMEMWTGFFVDDTMAELRSEEEIRAAFSAMSEEDRTGFQDRCDRAYKDRGSFGPLTLGLCDQITAM